MRFMTLPWRLVSAAMSFSICLSCICIEYHQALRAGRGLTNRHKVWYKRNKLFDTYLLFLYCFWGVGKRPFDSRTRSGLFQLRAKIKLVLQKQYKNAAELSRVCGAVKRHNNKIKRKNDEYYHRRRCGQA